MPVTFRDAQPGRLRSILAEHKTPILLLGAGASITSGIPMAGETVERAAKWAWCKENGRLFEDITVRPSDYKPWLENQNWFDPNVPIADLYPVAIDHLLGVKRDRRDFFEKLIAPPVPPGRGYRSLAKILHQGWIQTVLTTNFDDCLHKAATLENQPHYIARIRTLDDLVMFSSSPANPQLLHIHGSIEHYTDKNLIEEVQSLDSRIVDSVRPLLRDHPIIVVGYRGTEQSVMEGLFLNQIGFTHQFAQGIYWCAMNRNGQIELSTYVQQLASSVGSNFNVVRIESFDDLFELQLWNLLEAKKTPPLRQSAYDLRPAPSFDMQPSQAASLDAIDKILMQSRLKQYSSKLRYWTSNDDNWATEFGTRLHLIWDAKGTLTPTQGGLLLFGYTPSKYLPSSSIEVRLTGPVAWLRSCLGTDVELGEERVDGIAEADQVITGNLWHQLDQLTEILSLVNVTFRLKAELSKDVQAYNSIALKEAVVNALVHRDYERPEPIHVTIRPDSIKVVSPGGLIEEVRIVTGGVPLERLIKNDKRGIKGYRNPVISDLFYGGGQMDRAGSGLSDLWQTTINNNGTVTFGPDADNEFFTVELQARPEVADEITKTAIPSPQQTHRFSVNALPFHQIPDKVWCASTDAATPRSFYAKKNSRNLPRGYLHDRTFYTLFDLDRLRLERTLPFTKSSIFTMSLEELLVIPNGHNIFVKLLNEALFEHCKTIGLFVDYRRKRVYYPKTDKGDERKISYQARVRRATRTVVKARRKGPSAEIAYFEHKSLEFTPMEFGKDWALVLNPGYTFTRDGGGDPIGRERINILSTRRAAKDFNQVVHQDVAFWIAILSSEANGIFALRFHEEVEMCAPVILLSNRPPTVSYGVDSFDRHGEEWGNDLADLDREILELAEQEALEEKTRRAKDGTN